ncbi:MAG: hypothetical protein QXS16_02335 [Pyrobaculum sp.]
MYITLCEKYAANIAPLMFAFGKTQLNDIYSDVYFALRAVHAKQIDDPVLREYLSGLGEVIDEMIDEIPDDPMDFEAFKSCLNNALMVLYARSTVLRDIAERLKSYLTP